MAGNAVLRGASTIVGSRVAGLVFTLVQIKLAVGYLGPTGYGLLSTAVLLVGMFEALTELGVGSIVTRRVAAGGDLAHNVGLSQALTLTLMGPLVLLAIGTAVVLYDDPIVRLGCAILAVGLGGTAWAATYVPVAQSLDRFGGVSVADILGRVASLAIVVVAVVCHFDLIAFFVALLAAPLTRAVVAQVWGHRQGHWAPVWSMREVRELLVEALPLTYITVISGVYFNLDGLLLTKLTTTEQVGAYNFAYRIIVNVNIVSTALSSVLIARFSRAAATSDDAFRDVLRLAVPLLVGLCLPIAVLLGPFSSDIIELLGSTDFVPLSTRPLTLLWYAVAIALLTTVISAALIASHQQRVLVILNTVNLGLNAVVNVLLIPHWGAEGAAIALIATEASGLIVCCVVLTRRLGGRWVAWGQVVLLLGCTAATLLLERVLGSAPWVLRGFAVAAAYLVLAYACGVMTPARARRLSDSA